MAFFLIISAFAVIFIYLCFAFARITAFGNFMSRTIDKHYERVDWDKNGPDIGRSWNNFGKTWAWDWNFERMYATR